MNYARSVLCSTLGLGGCVAPSTENAPPPEQAVEDSSSTAPPPEGDTKQPESETGDGGTSSGGSSTDPVPLPVQCEGAGNWHGGQPDSYGGGDEGADDTTVGLGDDMPLALAIPDIQQGVVEAGTLIAIAGAIVTTPIARNDGDTAYEFFVQANEGGPYSGLRILIPSAALGTAIVPGTGVDLEGRLVQDGDLYALEVFPEAVTERAGGAMPAAWVLEASELLEDDLRAYEGVYVRVENATVTDPAPCDGEFVVDEIIRVDDRFAKGELPIVEFGEAVRGIQGVMAATADRYELAPPNARDVDAEP